MDVQSAKVAHVLDGIFDGDIGEILVAKGDNLLLGNEQREFVLAFGVKLRQLDSADLSPDGGGDIVDLDTRIFGEEVGKRRVGILAMLIMLEGLPGRVSMCTSVSASMIQSCRWHKAPDHLLYTLLVFPCGKIVGIGRRLELVCAMKFNLAIELVDLEVLVGSNGAPVFEAGRCCSGSHFGQSRLQYSD